MKINYANCRSGKAQGLFIPLLLISLAILNIFDAAATYMGVSLNLVEEVNPFMNFLIEKNPRLFLLVKFILSFILLMVIFPLRKKDLAVFVKRLLIFATCLYIVLTIYHLFWINLVLFI